jgi:hypothetical protein
MSNVIRMTPDSFISQAIEQGSELGLGSLEPVARTVFAISEAEVTCDINGIDGLFDRYGLASAATFSAAYRAIGAVEIGAAFELATLVTDPPPEELLARLNGMITERRGYSYQDIVRYVEQHV